MESLLASLMIVASSLFHLSNCQTISISTGTTKDSYLYTDKVSFGTPGQSFKLLIDTTDNTSWVYNKSANTPQSTFDPTSSSTFTQLTYAETWTYQNQSTEIQFANDTITVKGESLTKQTFGIAYDNFTIADTEGVSGVLSLNRINNLINALYNNQTIENKTVSIDVANDKLYFGPYTPSNIDNVSNATDCSSTNNEYLNEDWTFDIEVYIDGVSSLSSKTKGVIDAASPYITIYTKNNETFDSFWKQIDKSSFGGYNCNYTSRLCQNTGSIMTYMTIIVAQTQWNISIFREDILDGKYIQFLYDGDKSFTTEPSTDYVLFLGRPFLKHALVTLDYEEETLTFYSLAIVTTSLDWVTIGIVFACVLAFAGLFFGVYCWKYGKIPPPSNHDVEEQVSLLRGPVQAVGSGQAVGQGSSAPFTGISGLDEDDDDYQHQLQQAQRQSAIEAQQRREQQLREERERRQREEDEQKQQAMMAQQQQQQQSGQASGGRIGGSAAAPQDKDDLRARRLRFLEQQSKKELEDNAQNE